MLEIEYLLLTAVASLMMCNALPVVPKLDRVGVHLCLHLRTWFQWHRIRIRQDFRTPKAVHRWKARLRQIHAFGYHWQQVISFNKHRRAYRKLAALNSPLLIAMTGSNYLPV
jgi:hypothetical protein